MTTPAHVFAKYRWLAPMLWMLAGAMGFRIALPWDGITNLRAEDVRIHARIDSLVIDLHKMASALDAHLYWAVTRNMDLMERLDARSRYDCLKAKRSHDQYAWDLLTSSGVKCSELMGNGMVGK